MVISRQRQKIVLGAARDTPLGRIWVAATAEGLVAVSLWDDQDRFAAEVAQLAGGEPALVAAGETVVTEAVAQVTAYLAGERREFDLPIDWSVLTPFQTEVLRAVQAIPYGRLSTYGEIARQIGQPGAVRAVGRANATNPIPLVIPCHRVLGADGKLHGYSAPGGLETKAWLLRLEGSWLL
jgi:methylated-DNA-[protein]-cysteine S-methyltransferase